MTRDCTHCGAEFTPVRANAAYCGPACRRKAKFARGVARKADGPLQPRSVTGVEVATRAELVKAGAVDSASGQVALRLAVMLDVGDERAGAAMAAWARELRAALAEATSSVAGPVADPVDQLKARRAARTGS